MPEETKSIETTTEEVQVETELKLETESVPENESVLDSSKAVSSEREMNEQDKKGEMEHLLRMASTNPEIAEMEEVKNFMSTVDKVKTKDSKEEKEEKEEDNSILSDKSELKPKAGDELKEEETKEEEVIDNEDDVFGLQKKEDKDNSNRHDFKDDTDFKEYLKKKYSIENYNKFLNSVDKWRNDSQQVTDTDDKYNQLTEGLGSLPQPIKDAIDAYANAKDYKKAFTASVPLIDYSISLDEVSKENVVKFYYKDKLEAKKAKLDNGDIYEEDYKGYIDDLYDSASRLFTSEQKEWDRQRADIVSRDSDRENTIKTSANSSVDSLKEKYPNFSSNELKNIRTRLVQQDLNNLFFDKNGSYRTDAAERIALTLYGNKIISALKKQSMRDGETKANLDIVGRGNSTIETKGKSNSVDNREAKNAISYLSGEFGKDPYS